MDTVRDLKLKILDTLKVFQELDIYLQVSGKPLFDMEGPLEIFGIRQNIVISILELDKEYGINLEEDLMERHKVKITQLRSMFPQESDKYLSFVLHQNRGNLENSIGDFTSSMNGFY